MFIQAKRHPITVTAHLPVLPLGALLKVTHLHIGASGGGFGGGGGSTDN